MTTSSDAKYMQSKVTNILKEEQTTFQRLASLEQELNGAFSDMQEAVYALMLSLLTGEPLLFVGPPGTGKSMLIHMLCHCLNLYNLQNPGEPHEGFFEYLLTPFTEPTELFGHYDVKSLVGASPHLKRIENNMMRLATVVYLDEVFNGSSAILNSILAFMNERVVHDRGERNPAQWEFFFAATNRRPEARELEAIYDRFVLRCRVDNMDVTANDAPQAASDNLRRLVEVGWNQTYGRPVAKGAYKDLLIRLPALQQKIKSLTHSDNGNRRPELMTPEFFKTLATVVENARSFDLSQMSNRRIVKMTYVLFAHRLYKVSQNGGGSCLLGAEDLELVARYFLDNLDDAQGVQTLRKLVLTHSGNQ